MQYKKSLVTMVLAFSWIAFSQNAPHPSSIKTTSDSELIVLYKDLIRDGTAALLPEYTGELEEEFLSRPNIAVNLLENLLTKAQGASDFFDHSVTNLIVQKMKNSSKEYRDTVGHFFMTRAEALMDLNPSIGQIKDLNIHVHSEGFPIRILGITLQRTKSAAKVLETINALFKPPNILTKTGGIGRNVCLYLKALGSFYGGCDSHLRQSLNSLYWNGYLRNGGQVRRLARHAYYRQNHARILRRGRRKVRVNGYSTDIIRGSFIDAVRYDTSRGTFQGQRFPSLERVLNEKDDKDLTLALANLSDRDIGRLDRYIGQQNNDTSIGRKICSQEALADLLP